MNSYYPFGLEFNSYRRVTATPNDYLYNGKEKQDELGVAWLDYGARMYDPAIGRWGVVDPAIDFTLDPYGYVFNDPFNLLDENGEFPILSGIAGFFKGLFNGRNSFEENANTRMGNALRSAVRYEKQAWQILGGLGVTDKNKSLGGKALQLLSRFSWELPNTLAGVTTAELTNVFVNVNWVDYEAGATVLNTTNKRFGAFTLGSFIIGDNTILADPKDQLFRHEYGHYLQSQSFGPGYLPAFALPSVTRATLMQMGIIGGEYDDFYTESNATERGYDYFIKDENTDQSRFIPKDEKKCLGCYDEPLPWISKTNDSEE